MAVQDTSIPISVLTLVDNTTIDVDSGKIQIKNDGVGNTQLKKINPIIKQVYTGNGFDLTVSGSNGDGSHELTAVASTKADFVKIDINANYEANWVAGAIISSLLVQIKETGQAYANIEAEASIDIAFNDVHRSSDVVSKHYSVTATLTAGMKTNGYQLKIISEIDSTSGTAKILNYQTIITEF